MTRLGVRDCMEKYNFKENTMNEGDLQRAFNYNIYRRDSKLISNKGFVNIDIGQVGGTHWVCFIVKDEKIILF